MLGFVFRRQFLAPSRVGQPCATIRHPVYWCAPLNYLAPSWRALRINAGIIPPQDPGTFTKTPSRRGLPLLGVVLSGGWFSRRPA